MGMLEICHGVIFNSRPGFRQEFRPGRLLSLGLTDDYDFNPSFESRIHPGNTLTAVGEEHNLMELADELNPET